MKAKLEKIKRELSCINPNVKQPARKPEVFDAAVLESIGSHNLSQEETPTTPRIRHLNEDGEYEWETHDLESWTSIISNIY